jgi:hypothetical protein
MLYVIPLAERAPTLKESKNGDVQIIPAILGMITV